MPSLVAFFAHPDDEAFGCGGTLAAAAGRGMEVTVVCATRGEAGQALDGTPRGGLAERRSDELHRSCAALGVGPPRILDLPDGGLAENRGPLRARLGDALREIAPAAAITMGPDGAYGHLDHVVCSEILGEWTAARAEPPTVLHVVFPPGLFEPLRRRLQGSSVPLLSTLPSPQPADYEVDVRSVERRKLAAIAAHRSQLASDDPRGFLTPGLVDRLLAEERFRHAAGPRPGGILGELLVALR